MKKKTLLMMLVLMFIATSALSQPYTISGTISGDVQEGVTVSIYDTECGGDTLITDNTTDSAGNYSFSGLSDGWHTIRPEMDNYNFDPEYMYVKLPQSEPETIDFIATKYTCDDVYRFLDNLDGTVKDCRTNLIWLKNATCTDTLAGIPNSWGYLSWDNAIIWSSALDNGTCDLSDGSVVGDWRLPTKSELQSIGTDLPEKWDMGLPLGTWSMPSSPFVNVQSAYYWSCTTHDVQTDDAWWVDMSIGDTWYYIKTSWYNVWPVRSDN